MGNHLFVTGGNGFIGAEICRIAVDNGHQVTSISRSGPPNLGADEHPWTQEVNWVEADVFQADTWRRHLISCDALIHCVGTAQENLDDGDTFDHVNGDSAIRAAREANLARLKGFVMLSARENPPFVSDRYLSAKRRAEYAIRERYPNLRSVFLRPNLVYGERRTGTRTLAAVINNLSALPFTGGGIHEGRPLPVKAVAATAVYAAISPNIEGTLSVNQIDDIARTCGLVDAHMDKGSARKLYVAAGAVAGSFIIRKLFRRD